MHSYAAFLNAKSIGSDGKYAAGAYPTQSFIYIHSYSGSEWMPAVDCENTPVIHVVWYGAAEFASYMGGAYPTTAQTNPTDPVTGTGHVAMPVGKVQQTCRSAARFGYSSYNYYYDLGFRVVLVP